MNEPILELVQRWGWNATAFQILESGYQYFRTQDGVIAYFDTGETWVAAGAPVGPDPALAELTRAFISAATRAGRRACFALVERRLIARAALHSLQIGSQPVWDPTAWPRTLADAPRLRHQLRRATNKGVRVRKLTANELASPNVQARLATLTASWLATRHMPSLSFLVRVELHSHTSLRRVFIAERDGRLVAAAALVPVPARAGWLLEDLLRCPDAPNGTAELLFDTAMHALAAEDARWLTMGLVAMTGDVSPVLRAIGRVGSPLYDFAGLAAFRRRLRPAHWIPLYVAYPDRFGATSALTATLRALAGGSLRGFAARAVRARISAVAAAG